MACRGKLQATATRYSARLPDGFHVEAVADGAGGQRVLGAGQHRLQRPPRQEQAAQRLQPPPAAQLAPRPA